MEDFWKTVHWFATSKCNEQCVYCFKPEFEHTDTEKNTSQVAKTLVASGVEKVVFTGGEPLLLKSLDTGLEVLKGGGIDISIHTNSTLLTPKRTQSLAGIANEIAIPLDSLDRQTQANLRKTDCLPAFYKAFERLQEKEIRIGIHTVATSANIQHIPQIHEFLKGKKFNYWKVYEFNADLARQRATTVEEYQKIQILENPPATTEDGGVNCLFADFLLEEEKLTSQDPRIKFVGVRDYNRDPYFFLTTTGDVYYCNWFLQGKRKGIGNIVTEDFETVKKRIIEADEQDPLFDEDSFVDAENDLPLWARAAWQGNYFPEELKDVEQDYHERFIHLSQLYLQRLIKQEAAPADAEVCFEATV